MNTRAHQLAKDLEVAAATGVDYRFTEEGRELVAKALRAYQTEDDKFATTDPRILLIVRRTVMGKELQITKEVPLLLITQSRAPGSMLAAEIRHALSQVLYELPPT